MFDTVRCQDHAQYTPLDNATCRYVNVIEFTAFKGNVKISFEIENHFVQVLG